MDFITVWTYDNYVPAHIAMGRLKEDGINAWLKDENTVTIDPLLTNAVGGIKLMVNAADAEEALLILQETEREYKAGLACPRCGSHNFEWVSSPRKSMTWISAIATWLMASFAMSKKIYRCFDCSNEFETPVQVQKTEDGNARIPS